MWGHSETSAEDSPWLNRTQPRWHSDPRLPASSAVRKEISAVYKPPSLWHLLQQPEQIQRGPKGRHEPSFSQASLSGTYDNTACSWEGNRFLPNNQEESKAIPQAGAPAYLQRRMSCPSRSSRACWTPRSELVVLGSKKINRGAHVFSVGALLLPVAQFLGNVAIDTPRNDGQPSERTRLWPRPSQVNLEDLVLSEMSRTPRTNPIWLHLLEAPEGRMLVARDWGRWSGDRFIAGRWDSCGEGGWWWRCLGVNGREVTGLYA